MVTAQATGQRVQDESQTSQTSLVFANPDGTWSAEVASEPVRVRDEAGAWQDVDTTLVERGGGLVPRYAAAEVSFSAGGERTFARVSEGGKDLAWRWPSVLPEPAIDGPTATYPGVAAGGVGDLVVTATGTGFSHSVVLHEQPTGPVDFTIPVVTQGADLAETPTGGLEITAGSEALVTAPEPLMWDASTDADGLPAEVVPVATTVGETAAGTPSFTLSPDEGFLADPATVYPVTVDPTFSAYATGDTWILSDGSAANTNTEYLQVGTSDSGATKARAYLHFDGSATSSWVGKQIVSASLVLRNFSSLSCAGSAIAVKRVTSEWSGSTLTWSNRPTSTSAETTTYVPAHGGTSCAADDAVWSIAPMVQQWADGAANHGVILSANDETTNASYRRYRSANYQSYTYLRPRISFTTNSYPNTASAAVVSPGNPGYATSLTPTLSATVTDPDKSTVKGRFEILNSAGTLVWSGLSADVASGGPAKVTVPAGVLSNGTTYTVRVKGRDAYVTSKSWSTTTSFTVDTTAPLAPGIAASNVTEGVWTANPPASNTFTLTGPADAASFTYQLDNGTARTITATSGSASVSWAPAAGSHTLSVKATDKAGNGGTWRHYTFGVGGSLVATESKVPQSTDTFPITASGPPGATSARLEWRYASEAAWNPMVEVDQPDGTPWTGSVSAGVAGSEVNDLIWDATAEVVPDAAEPGTTLQAPALVETRACFTYSGTSEVCSTAQALQLVPSAFGGTFPTATAGPGEVALWTGEFGMSTTDVAETGTGGSGLSISRSYGSYTGPRTSAAAVFGPGWTASLDGPDAGLAGYQLIDNTLVDGTLVLSSGEGHTMVFAPEAGLSTRTTADLPTGAWVGVDETTPMLGLAAEVTGTGDATRFRLTDEGGVLTIFKATTAPTTTSAGVFAAESVQEPGAAGVTSFTRDGAGRVTRILSPLPAGMTAADCTVSSWAAGCRAVEIGYATTTTATTSAPGEVAGQVKQITLRVYDPAEPAGATRVMATYAYNADKRLVTATDAPTGLATGYGYHADGLLATVTPAGLTPITLEYAGGRLARVKRDRPTASGGGTATLATILYGLRPDQQTAGLPDLRAATTLAGWGQETAPVYGAAVFGPDKPISTLDPTQVAAADWPYAALWFTDTRGRTINTGVYGAGDWQLDYTSFDEFGNPVRQLGAGDIAAIRTGATTVENAGTLTVYNGSTLGAGAPPAGVPDETPAGTVVTDVYGPAREVRDPTGAVTVRRPHTHYDYDQGAPDAGVNPATGAGWAMVTTETAEAVDAESLTPVGSSVSVVKIGYGTTTAAWTLGASTTSTVVMGSGEPDIVTVTGYDAEGRVVEQRQPKSGGTDAGTRRTVYYTAAANSTHPTCGGKPEWAGQVCRIHYAGAPSSGPALPDTVSSGLDKFTLAAATVTETANGATRTSQTQLDGAGRLKKSWTTLTGMPSAPAPGLEVEYDAGTGLPVRKWATDATGARTGSPEVTGYDAWGRVESYAPAGETATTTVYDAVGRVASVTDPKGTSTWTYDGTDATGKTERRGLPTQLVVTAPTGDLTFTGAYDPVGALTVEKLPGGITRRVALNTAGEQTGLTYTGAVTTDGVTDPDGVWLAWTTDRDITGRVAREWTPAGAGVTSGLPGAAATGYARSYTYDRAARLSKVVDLTAPAGSAEYDSGELTGTTCQTRSYEFDASGNRTTLTKTGANADGTCATTGGTTKTWAHDTADRITGGYVYDAFGRATTIPAADTPAVNSGQPTAGALTIGYYDGDQAKTITQNGTTTAFTLDESGRRAVETTGPTGGPATKTTTRHYTDGSDNPGWIAHVDNGNASTTRYINGLSGRLAATVTTGAGAGVKLSVVDPHGDSPTTIDLPSGTGTATGIGGWADTDEYGNPTQVTGSDIRGSSTPGIGYGWLGAHERATTDTGLILMGARLYNRATGAFTSTDPIYGGNTSPYAYPTDPVNSVDFTGLFEVAFSFYQRTGYAWREGFWRTLSRWSEYYKNSVMVFHLDGYFGAANFAGEMTSKGIIYNLRTVITVEYGYHRGVWSKREKWITHELSLPWARYRSHSWSKFAFGNVLLYRYPVWLKRHFSTRYGPITRG